MKLSSLGLTTWLRVGNSKTREGFFVFQGIHDSIGRQAKHNKEE